MAMPPCRTVFGPPRRRRHERTACSSLANSDIAPSSFLEIPLLWGGEHWEGGLERAWRSQDLSSRSGGAKRTVILTMSRRVYRSPRVGRLIFWQDRPGRRRTGHDLAGIRGTNEPYVEEDPSWCPAACLHRMLCCWYCSGCTRLTPMRPRLSSPAM